MGKMYEWGVAFDWISPTLHVINLLRGHKAIEVTVDEMKKLRQHGINCHAPMLDPVAGTYITQVSGGDYKRACKVLGQ